jgi:hypothetical protein
MKTGETKQESAVGDFRAAVHALSNDPSRRNLVRYLMASRALELSRNDVASKPGVSRPKAYRVQAA